MRTRLANEEVGRDCLRGCVYYDSVWRGPGINVIIWGVCFLCYGNTWAGKDPDHFALSRLSLHVANSIGVASIDPEWRSQGQHIPTKFFAYIWCVQLNVRSLHVLKHSIIIKSDDFVSMNYIYKGYGVL